MVFFKCISIECSRLPRIGRTVDVLSWSLAFTSGCHIWKLEPLWRSARREAAKVKYYSMFIAGNFSGRPGRASKDEHPISTRRLQRRSDV